MDLLSNHRRRLEIIIDALYAIPDIRERTNEKMNNIGMGYWYFQVNDIDIHDVNNWVYLPYHTSPRDIREAIEGSDLSSIIFAATSAHTPVELLNRDINKICEFSWRRQ